MSPIGALSIRTSLMPRVGDLPMGLRRPKVVHREADDRVGPATDELLERVHLVPGAEPAVDDLDQVGAEVDQGCR